MNVAVVFPGQGAQEVGMGRGVYQSSPAARAVFEAADAALQGDPRPLSVLCFEGPEAELTLTANTQPAVLAASVATLAALRARIPSLRPVAYAGHSLGEYSALVAAGALDLAEAVSLVRLRGQAMQDAVAPGVGAMAAVLMLDDAIVRELCAQVAEEMPGRVISPANYNSPGQVVVAGHADAVARVGELAAPRRGKVAVLKVSAPFHCALMQPAAEALAQALASVTVRPMTVPVVSNVEARPSTDAGTVRSLLVRQVAGTVQWTGCVQALLGMGVTHFVEVGPGKVLAGLIKRIHKGAVVWSVSDPDGIESLAAALDAG